MPALAPNSFIVITGVTGYIGSHVGLVALKDGHRVRGTVRSLEQAQALKEAYTKNGIRDIDSRLELVVVDDLHSVDQYLRALEGVDGVVHIALPMSGFSSNEFVLSAIDITTALLRAAKQVPSVKRVVITSSSTAVITPPTFVDRPLTENDWNHEAVRLVEEEVSSGKTSSEGDIYAAAKTKAELAAWNFMEHEKPQFDLVTILPNMNFGPVLHGGAKSTGTWLEMLLKGDGTILQFVPPQWWLDVRDSGRLHVKSLTSPSLSGKRLVAVATPIGWNQILGIMRKRFPNLPIPADVSGPQGEIDKQKYDNRIATEMLGGQWMGLEQALVEFATSIGY